MIKFFRKIRQNLLSEGKTGTYLKYAIGEIVLVVVGILIALQINNANERNKILIAEQQILLGLKNETNSNIEKLKLVTEANKVSLEYANILTQYFENPKKLIEISGDSIAFLTYRLPGALFVPENGMSTGLLNVNAYPKFAMFCALIMISTILLSVYGTKHTIPKLPKIQKQESLKSLFKNLTTAFKMKSFNSLVLFTMMIYIALGIGNSMITYFLSFFFELNQNEIAIIIFSGAIGGVISLFTAPKIGEKFDKKTGVIISTFLFGLFMSSPFNLRIFGFFPENGDPHLIVTYFLFTTIAYIFLWTSMSLVNSMMADVVDEYESITNQRHEGLFFSTMSFAYKLTVGLGYFFAGILLKLISFPTQTEIENIPTEIISKLGLIGGPLLMIIYFLSIFFILKYPITKQKYLEIRKKLQG